VTSATFFIITCYTKKGKKVTKTQCVCVCVFVCVYVCVCVCVSERGREIESVNE